MKLISNEHAIANLYLKTNWGGQRKVASASSQNRTSNTFVFIWKFDARPLKTEAC